MTNGQKTGVKGLKYEFTSSGNPTVFSAEVKENANVWFRRYNNAAAFDASEQEFGSAASFAGSDTPTITPNHAGSDVQTGEVFSVSQIPDGTQVKSFPTQGSDSNDITFDGEYLWTASNGDGTIYKQTLDGVQKDSFTPPGGDLNAVGLTWDGQYLWVGADAVNTVYQVDTNGNQVSSFAVTESSNARPFGLGWSGSYLYVTESTSHTIYVKKVDGTTVNSFASPFTANAGDSRAAVPDGKYLYHCTPNSGDIKRFDKQGNVVETFTAGTGSRGCTWNGDYLITVDGGGNNVVFYGGSNSLDISYRYGEVT